MERNFLREYKKFKFYDVGPIKDNKEGDHRIEINKPDEEYAQCVYFDSTESSNALNKAIEKAKQWVDRELKENTSAAESESLRYSDEELREFSVIIENKIEGAEKEYLYLKSVIDKPDDEQFPKEQLEQMLVRQQTFIDNLKAALTRIADKTYGICKLSGKLIDKARLRAVPHATLHHDVKSNDLKKEEEKTISPVEEHFSEQSQDTSERKCRMCGCTDEDCTQCIEKTGKPCRWVEPDLCSACVPDVAKSKLPEPTETISPTLNTEIVMDFFKQLAGMGKVDLTMRIMQKDDKLSVSLFPSGGSKMQPIVVTGTPGELDDEFFTSIAPAMKEVTGIISNIKEVKEAAAKKSEPKPQSKPAPKKAAAGQLH